MYFALGRLLIQETAQISPSDRWPVMISKMPRSPRISGGGPPVGPLVHLGNPSKILTQSSHLEEFKGSWTGNRVVLYIYIEIIKNKII
jgi:hypothetical protein